MRGGGGQLLRATVSPAASFGRTSSAGLLAVSSWPEATDVRNASPAPRSHLDLVRANPTRPGDHLAARSERQDAARGGQAFASGRKPIMVAAALEARRAKSPAGRANQNRSRKEIRAAKRAILPPGAEPLLRRRSASRERPWPVTEAEVSARLVRAIACHSTQGSESKLVWAEAGGSLFALCRLSQTCCFISAHWSLGCWPNTEKEQYSRVLRGRNAGSGQKMGSQPATAADAASGLCGACSLIGRGRGHWDFESRGEFCETAASVFVAISDGCSAWCATGPCGDYHAVRRSIRD